MKKQPEENNEQNPSPQNPPMTQQEKTIRKRSISLQWAGGILAFAAFLAGNFCCAAFMGPDEPWGSSKAPLVCLILALVLPAVLWGLNELAIWAFGVCLDRQKAKDVRAYLNRSRENAEQDYRKSITKLALVRTATAIHALVLGLLGLAVCFFTGVLPDLNSFAIPFCLLWGGFLTVSAFLHIPTGVPKEFFKEDDTYVSEDDFPILYEIANRAKEKIGCRGKVHICIRNDDNIGAATYEKEYSIHVGALLLSLLTEEELYGVFLHEFTHVHGTKYDSEADRRYYDWLMYGRMESFLPLLCDKPCRFWNLLYCFSYQLYRNSTTVLVELEADRGMLRCHNPETAGSALIKCHYANLFAWEDEILPFTNLYSSPTAEGITYRRQLEHFHEVVAKRAEVWNQFIPKEIPAKNSTHPTVGMRLQAMGLTVEDCHAERTLCGTPCNAEYAAEREKVTDRIDELIHRNIKDDYADCRREYYEKPLSEVEAWEAAGRPLNNESYRDVAENLKTLGRVEEAQELLGRAAENCPPSAAHWAWFQIGNYRLHTWDESGIELIYKAIDCNKNYVDEGMELIGEFACMTGNQAELDRYRERALELYDEMRESYDQISELNRGDRLSAETELPKELFDEIMAFIRSVEGGTVDRIYLVRKTVSEDFFASVFVIRFLGGVDSDARREVLHKIFTCLDSISTWQFSLLDYDELNGAKPQKVEGSLVYDRETEADS